MTLNEIHNLEMQEDYPTAIDALEERIKAYPNESETVIRLGFNLWYAVVENERLAKNLLVEKYATRFTELYKTTREAFIENTDYCWAYGLGLSMFWYHFPNTTEEEGKALLNRAKEKDIFWARFMQQSNFYERLLQRFASSIYWWIKKKRTKEILMRLDNRGIFTSYYNVAFYRDKV